MSAYYNEFKPEAAHMLRQLIRDGLIADGEVDERSITEVSSDDIKGFTQCHFFAGIGGWSVALRRAGWPDDRFVWTGSCPCQPFSAAGKQKGKEDERHLWPVWFRLIRESKPPSVFGEQVSSAIRFGWWDEVADDLEGIGYATRAEVRPASGAGRGHKRDRLWFVADSELLRCERQPQQYASGVFEKVDEPSESWEPIGAYGASYGWFDCPDGKRRPVEPSIFLLAHGVQHRAPLLHGYGNAIVPQVAAQFIKATGNL